MAKNSTDTKVLLTLLGMFIFVMIFWNHSFIYPIKIFVVMLHEMSHGLAAELTGGDMMKIELSPQIGGVCWSRGGIRWIILPAGYLGSMFFGGLILLGAARTRHDKEISTFIGIIMIALTLYGVRNTFGIVFGLLFGGAMILAGYILSEQLNDILLKFIGLTSTCYAVIDIKEDLISRTVPGSDAFEMSKIIPLPPVVWGVIWIVIAIFVTWKFITVASERGEET
jgi:hypothetical protein